MNPTPQQIENKEKQLKGNILNRLRYRAPFQDEMDSISKYAPPGTKYDMEKMVTFSMVMTNNLPGINKSKWSVSDLYRLADSFKGKSVRYDHNDSVLSSVGFVWDTMVLSMPAPPKNYYSEDKKVDMDVMAKDGDYKVLMGLCATEKGSQLDKMVKYNLANSLSTGVSTAGYDAMCPECMTSYSDANCPHYPPMSMEDLQEMGYEQDEILEMRQKMTDYYLRSATHLNPFEISMVSLPNFPMAQIVNNELMTHFEQNYDYIWTNYQYGQHPITPTNQPNAMMI